MRLVPSTILVTTISDAVVHAGESLRDAITLANTDAAGGTSDTIFFAPTIYGQTVTLTQGVLELNGAGSGTITIEGYNQISVSGDDASEVFLVDSGVQAVFDGLTIELGSSTFGGGISNAGTLTVSNSTVSGNTATSTLGGGVYNLGSLTLSDSTISGNTATTSGGGVYNNGYLYAANSTISTNYAGSSGGGVINLSTVILSGSTVSGNSAEPAAAASTIPAV